MPSPLLTSFSAMRLAVGAISWLAPGAAARLFGLPPDTSAMLTRLFGAREVALALGALSTDKRVRRSALVTGMAIDSADTAASLMETANGKIDIRGGVLMGGGAALFTALGAASLTRLGRAEVSSPVPG